MGVSNTDNVPGILEHWWDTSTTFVAPTAQLATTTMVNNTVYSPNSNILPAATNTYNLGGASNYWLYAFVLNYIGYNISLYNSTAGNYVGIASPSTASGTILTLPNANDTLVAKATTDILSNKRVKPRVSTASAPGATPSMNTDNYDLFEFTGLAAAITSMTTNLTGTPNDGDQLAIRFTDSGTARAITWGAKFLPSGTQALLATTVISKTHLVRFLWDATKAAWMCFYVDASGY
jgi:hypothetical protein